MTAPEAPPRTGTPPAAARSASMSARLGPALFGLGLLVLWTYLGCVFLYRGTVLGVTIGAAAFGLLFAFGCVSIALLAGVPAVRTRISADRMLNIGLVLVSSVTFTIVADTLYTIWANLARNRSLATIATDVRQADANVWHGELMPRVYRPTDRNFMLFKPDVRLTAETFGEFYNPAMKASRTLVDSVLQLREVSYHIGPHGLRDLESLAESRIFALGDSFVFGYATKEGKVWTDLLGASLGQPVYNMGVSMTGPRSQLMLLEHFLTTMPDSMRIEELLWMLFEGNDLESDYVDLLPAPESTGAGALLDGTLAQAVVSIPGRIRNQSVLRRALHGELLGPFREIRPDPRYEADGVPLSFPLYHSSRWGYRMFNPQDIDRATKPRAYLEEHPNRPLLDATFRDMQELSTRFGFRVTVMVAPSAARVYGAAFTDFPELSAQPHFSDYVLALAAKSGFRTLDLLAGLKPYAAEELLYYRDDHHWNERGNEVAARVIEDALWGPRPGPF